MSKIARILAVTALLVLGGTATAHAATPGSTAAARSASAVTVHGMPCMAC